MLQIADYSTTTRQINLNLRLSLNKNTLPLYLTATNII